VKIIGYYLKDQCVKDQLSKYDIAPLLSEEVLSMVTLCEYKAGERIIREGYPIDYYYFFIEGRLKITRDYENGKSLLIQFYTKMDSLGEVEMVSGDEATCTVSCIMDSLLLRIPMNEMKKLVQTHLPFALYVSQSLTKKLVSANHNQAFNLLYPVKQRLASYLLWHCNAENIVVLDEYFKDISEFIGSSYRQFCRAMQALVTEGYITKNRKYIKIVNYDTLLKLAGHIYLEG
jgi:CRP-like cAMP-binding protein